LPSLAAKHPKRQNKTPTKGFPRADVDVHAVRVDRNAVICGTNDHKALTARIERLMHELHAAARCACARCGRARRFWEGVLR
jgi:hypothetical protein